MCQHSLQRWYGGFTHWILLYLYFPSIYSITMIYQPRRYPRSGAPTHLLPCFQLAHAGLVCDLLLRGVEGFRPIVRWSRAFVQGYMPAYKHCKLFLPTSRSAIIARQFLESQVINRVLTTRLVQWLSWVFAPQKRNGTNQLANRFKIRKWRGPKSSCLQNVLWTYRILAPSFQAACYFTVSLFPRIRSFYTLSRYFKWWETTLAICQITLCIFKVWRNHFLISKYEIETT